MEKDVNVNKRRTREMKEKRTDNRLLENRRKMKKRKCKVDWKEEVAAVAAVLE